MFIFKPNDLFRETTTRNNIQSLNVSCKSIIVDHWIALTLGQEKIDVNHIQFELWVV